MPETTMRNAEAAMASTNHLASLKSLSLILSIMAVPCQRKRIVTNRPKSRTAGGAHAGTVV